MARKPGKRFTEDQIRAIRSSGKSLKELAKEYGVDRTSISSILRRKSYKHVASDVKPEVNERAVVYVRPSQVGVSGGLDDIDVAVILDAVVSIFDVTKDELLSSLRDKELADSRALAMYLTRRHTPLSLTAIGDEFNKKDSTVVQAVRKIEALLDENGEVRQDLRILEGVLGLDPEAKTDEMRFCELVNELRESKGLQPLKLDDQLGKQARLWAAQMVKKNRLLDFGEQVNQGVTHSDDIEPFFRVFERSPSHKENFLAPSVTHHGVAVIRDTRGLLWAVYHSKTISDESDNLEGAAQCVA